MLGCVRRASAGAQHINVNKKVLIPSTEVPTVRRHSKGALHIILKTWDFYIDKKYYTNKKCYTSIPIFYSYEVHGASMLGSWSWIGELVESPPSY
jgi:hypothetical protein